MSKLEGNRPMEFVRHILPERHCALFYENHAYARRIEFAFIEQGLSQGERCFYLTHSDEETRYIEGLMREREALRNGMTKGLLSTYRDSFVPESPEEIPALFEERLKRMLQGSLAPYRFVGVTIPDIKTAKQIATQTEMEAAPQRSMTGPSATILCNFPVEKVEEDIRNDWFLKMIKNHHSAIFAPKTSEGIAFDVR